MRHGQGRTPLIESELVWVIEKGSQWERGGSVWCPLWLRKCELENTRDLERQCPRNWQICVQTVRARGLHVWMCLGLSPTSRRLVADGMNAKANRLVFKAQARLFVRCSPLKWILQILLLVHLSLSFYRMFSWSLLSHKSIVSHVIAVLDPSAEIILG